MGGDSESTKIFVQIFLLIRNKVHNFVYKTLCMNKNIIKWFESHPLFSINGMCKLIGIDGGNFTRSLQGGKIPEKHIPKIEGIIKQYGYISQK